MEKADFQAVRNSNQPLDAWNVVKRVGLNLGFSFVWGYRLSLLGISEPTLTMLGGDQAWPQHFINRDYGPIDPARLVFTDNPFSFDLGDILEKDLSMEQQKMINEMHAFGIDDALYAHARTHSDFLDVIMFGCSGASIPGKGDDQRERLMALATLALVKEAKFEDSDADALEQLTPKELEILRLLPVSNSNKDLAYRAGIRPSTLDTHLKNIKQKTGVKKKIDLIMLALGSNN